MAYVRKIIAKDEDLVGIARLHWIYVIRGLFWFLVMAGAGWLFNTAITRVVLMMSSATGAKFIPAALLTVSNGAMYFLMAGGFMIFFLFVIKVIVTEVALTTRRVIEKSGLLFVKVKQVDVEEIRGDRLDLGHLGRILGYGYLFLDCRFIGDIRLPAIENPERFLRALQQVRTKAQDSLSVVLGKGNPTPVSAAVVQGQQPEVPQPSPPQPTPEIQPGQPGPQPEVNPPQPVERPTEPVPHAPPPSPKPPSQPEQVPPQPQQPVPAPPPSEPPLQPPSDGPDKKGAGVKENVREVISDLRGSAEKMVPGLVGKDREEGQQNPKNENGARQKQDNPAAAGQSSAPSLPSKDAIDPKIVEAVARQVAPQVAHQVAQELVHQGIVDPDTPRNDAEPDPDLAVRFGHAAFDKNNGLGEKNSPAQAVH